MALTTFTQAPYNNTDALFRLWGSALSTALSTVGLVQTSDTGQINWTTVLKPGAANTVMGYEIWRFNDTLQATYPVFIKIEYGSAAAATTPALWITVGVSTDGAGNLTGLTTTRRQLVPGGSSATATWVSRISGGTNRIAVAMWIDAGATTYSMLFGVERTHDSAGADTNEGILLISGYGAGNNQLVTYLNGSGVVSTETSLPALLPSVGTGSSGSAVALYPVFPTKGVYLNPLANWLIAFQANVSPGTAISFTYYGATRAFMPLSNTSIVSVVRGTVSGTCFLMRNE